MYCITILCTVYICKCVEIDFIKNVKCLLLLQAPEIVLKIMRNDVFKRIGLVLLNLNFGATFSIFNKIKVCRVNSRPAPLIHQFYWSGF